VSTYCNQHGDAVLNDTIDEYACTFIEPTRENPVCFTAQDVGCHFEVAADKEMEIPCAVRRRINTPLLTTATSYARTWSLVRADKNLPPEAKDYGTGLSPSWEETVENR
jgi:galactokinase/mevalonate kinase-like predicted kinase